MINISCHHIAEKQIHIQNTKHNKNRTNDTYTGEIYDAASLLNIILCNPRKFHSVFKNVGIRESFFSTKKEKKYQFPRVVRMAIEHIFG